MRISPGKNGHMDEPCHLKKVSTPEFKPFFHSVSVPPSSIVALVGGFYVDPGDPTYKADHTQKDVIHDVHLAFLLDFSLSGFLGFRISPTFWSYIQLYSITNTIGFAPNLGENDENASEKGSLENHQFDYGKSSKMGHKWAMFQLNCVKLPEGKQGVRKNQLLVLYQTSTVALTAFWGIICVQRKWRWRTSILGYLDLSRR